MKTYEQSAIDFASHTHQMLPILGYYHAGALARDLELLARRCEWLVYDEKTLRRVHES